MDVVQSPFFEWLENFVQSKLSWLVLYVNIVGGFGGLTVLAFANGHMKPSEFMGLFH